MGKTLSRHCRTSRREPPLSVTSVDDCVDPCKGTTDPECPCLTFDKLATLNDRLRVVRLELVEILPGRLSLSWYESPWESSKLELAATSQYGPRHSPVLGDGQEDLATRDSNLERATALEMEERTRALRLVQDILATHRCIAVVEVEGRTFCGHEDLLRDAITSAGSSLRAFRVRDVYRFSRPLVDDLGDAVGALSHLRELTWTYDKLQKPLSGRLLTFFRTTSSLTSLDLTEIHMPFPNAEKLFSALKKNSSLIKLTLSACLVITEPDETSGLLRDYLSRGHCDHLLSLTVRKSCTSHPPSLSAIVDGVCENRTLQDLSVAGFFLGRWNFGVVAKLLSENRTLRRLTLIGTSWFEVFQGSFKSRDQWKRRESEAPNSFPRCLQALAGHRSLELLTVDVSTFTVQQCFALCEAVHANKLLSAVTLARVQNEDVGPFCDVIRKTKTEHRVRLDHGYILKEGSCNDVVQYPALIKKVVLDRSNFREPQMMDEALRSLPRFDQVNSLSLNVDISQELFGDVATFLKTTTSLRRLDLSIPTSEPGNLEPILHVLGQNRSIRTLRIHKMRIADPEIQLLATTVADSSTLCEFGFFVEDNECATLKTFLWELEPWFSCNYSILELSHSRVDDCPKYLSVQRIPRRNMALAVQASHFVLGVNVSKRCARALEQVSNGQGVVRTVAGFASVDETTAAELVQQAMGRLADMTTFMKIAGVVRETLVCHTVSGENLRGGPRLQLDQLDADSWRHVRRYIRLADILDSDFHPPL